MQRKRGEKKSLKFALSSVSKELQLLTYSVALKKTFHDLFVKHSSTSRGLSRNSPGRKQHFQTMDMKLFPRDEIITIPNVFPLELISQSMVNMSLQTYSCSKHCLFNVCVARNFSKRITSIRERGLFKRKVQNVTWMQTTKSCVLHMWM